MHRRKTQILILSLFSLVPYARGVEKSCPTQPLTVMAYNVENLFDAVNDMDQKDETFLPLSVKDLTKCDGLEIPYYQHMCKTLDWTDWKYGQKLKNIASVVTQYDGGQGPDILALEELENRTVIQDLFEQHLRIFGYRNVVHFESPDPRGMDVGLVSKFPLARSATPHAVDLNGDGIGDSRDVLEVPLQIGAHVLTVLVNHWPSQNKPTEARMKAASVVSKIVSEVLARGEAVLVMGDFNVPDSETPNPILGNIASSEVSSFPLVDLQPFFSSATYPGTEYYAAHKEWSRFDRILASKNLMNGEYPIQVQSDGFEIFAPEEIRKPVTNFPIRFDFYRATGYSDHFPVAAQLQYCR